MKIISKEKSWLGLDINYKLYCFEERNYNYISESFYNYYYKFISDITVNENNQLHSFNDKPALIYKDEKNILCKEWFVNGVRERLNPEKPKIIIKGYGYILNNGKLISFKEFKKNIKKQIDFFYLLKK